MEFTNGQMLRLVKECSITKAYHVRLGTVHIVNITDTGFIVINVDGIPLVLRKEQFEPIDDTYHQFRESLKEIINEHTILLNKTKELLLNS